MKKIVVRIMPPKIDEKLCDGCGMCIDACPSEVLVLENEKAKVANEDDCTECEICVDECPNNAIKM